MTFGPFFRSPGTAEMAVDFQELPVRDAQRQSVERGSIILAIRRRTALCLYCAVDSVILDASGWPLDADLLKKMKLWWFETSGVPLD